MYRKKFYNRKHYPRSIWYERSRYRKSDFYLGDLLMEMLVGIGFVLGKLLYIFVEFLYRLVVLLWRKLSHQQKISEMYVITPNPVPVSVSPEVLNDQQVSASQSEPVSESRYALNKSLLTLAEQEFFKVLEEAVGQEYRITSQVPLLGIVNPKDSGKGFMNYRDFNKIKAKRIDFMLCDKVTWAPVLAIELDDRSHLRFDRIRRDHFVNELMDGVGLPILHVHTSYEYDLQELKSDIFERIRP